MFWIITGLFAAFSEATKDFFSKHSMKNVNPWLASWSLFVFTLPLFFVAMFFTGIPELGPLFFPALITNTVTYIISIVIYMKAISKSPLSLTLPILAFTPAFILITGPLILQEFPKITGIIGILSIITGAYVLKSGDIKKGILAPFKSLFKEKGVSLMLVVAVIWSFTATLGKLLVEQSSPVFSMASQYIVTSLIFSLFVFATKKVKLNDVKKNFRKIFGIGFFMSLSEISLAYTYTLTLAVYAIAVKRLSILIGSFYGFKFFKEGEVLQRISGSLLMILGIILMAL